MKAATDSNGQQWPDKSCFATMTSKRQARRIEFTGAGEFAAYRAAETWCIAAGYSVGRMQRDEPIGLMFGDADISKWRNMTRSEQAELDGVMTGNFRNGPVVVETYHS